MKKLFIILLFAPIFCYGQQDYCKKIKEKVDVTKSMATFKSPDLKYFSVIKQFSINTLFALHIHLKDDHEHFESQGVSIEFEDGTILKDESVPLDCKQEMSMFASGSDANGSTSHSGQYVLQGFFPINDDNIGIFTSKKITRVTLENVSVNIHNKDAIKIMNYIICLKEMKP